MNIFCQLNECQTTAGCAHRGPQGEYCSYQPKVIGTKPCPYCLGTGKMTVIEFPASSNIFGPASANEGSASMVSSTEGK